MKNMAAKVYIKGFSNGTLEFLSGEIKSLSTKTEFEDSTKNQIKLFFRKEFLPINKTLACLAENDIYIFDLETTFFSKGITPMQISVGSTSKDIKIAFLNGETTWVKDQDYIPEKVVITTLKSKGYSHIYISYVYEINGRKEYGVCAASFMANISADSAKLFLDENMSIEKASIMSLKQELNSFEKLLSVEKSFIPEVINNLTNLQIQELISWTGWNTKIIQEYTKEEQIQYYNQYRQRNYAYRRITAENSSQSDSIKVIFTNNNLATFAEYSCGSENAYFIFQSKVDINTIYYKTDVKPVLYSTERTESTVEIFYFLKNNLNFDAQFLIKDINLSNELSVICKTLPNAINVFWKAIATAVNYHVEIFNYGDSATNSINSSICDTENTFLLHKTSNTINYVNEGRLFEVSKIRYMYKEHMDRDRCFYSQSCLTSGTYFIRLAAENRNGDIIAKSHLVKIDVTNQSFNRY